MPKQWTTIKKISKLIILAQAANWNMKQKQEGSTKWNWLDTKNILSWHAKRRIFRHLVIALLPSLQYAMSKRRFEWEHAASDFLHSAYNDTLKSMKNVFEVTMMSSKNLFSLHASFVLHSASVTLQKPHREESLTPLILDCVSSCSLSLSLARIKSTE